MSFLPLDELEPTLSDVLAFIDAFSTPDSVQSSPTSSDITVSSAAKRKQSRAAASRRFQHKKKAELLALRVQVSALQRRLQELHRKETSTAKKKLDETQKSSVVGAWLHKAELEKQLRLLAEARNRQLKTVLSRQKQTATTVDRLLQNVTAVVHVEESLRTPNPTGFVPNLDNAIYGDLAARMNRLYVDADDVFAVKQEERYIITEKVEIQWDPVTGAPYVELRGSTPVQMSVHDAANIGHKSKPAEMKQHKHVQTEQGVRKESEIELQDQARAISVNVRALGRKYDEDTRVLNMWTSLVCDHPLNASVRFREQGWVMISASPSNPQGASLVQICYRLSPDVDAASPASQDWDDRTIFVLQKLGSVMLKNFVGMGDIFAQAGASR